VGELSVGKGLPPFQTAGRAKDPSSRYAAACDSLGLETWCWRLGAAVEYEAMYGPAGTMGGGGGADPWYAA
jgi:hypothetical protein